jgi:ER-bound oxygenase mpaB/B'/Rubber oxygenase, catalytic domain
VCTIIAIFETDTMGRLHRTLEGTNRIAFGRASEAEAIKARPTAVHGKVWGTVSPGINGPHDYSAFEPDLLFWVLATLISAAVNGYEFIYGALSIAPGRRPERADASAVSLFPRRGRQRKDEGAGKLTANRMFGIARETSC